MKFRQSLFWDTNPDKIDPQKNAKYIIEKVMDFGRDEEVRWLWNFYDKSLLREVVNKSRSLRAETRNLWNHLLTTK
jgi:hypothetical protein